MEEKSGADAKAPANFSRAQTEDQINHEILIRKKSAVSRQLVRDLHARNFPHRQRDDHALGLLEEAADLGQRRTRRRRR